LLVRGWEQSGKRRRLLGLRVRKRGDEGKETSYVLLKFLGTSFPPENLSF
jgi:hypothetical protein